MSQWEKYLDRAREYVEEALPFLKEPNYEATDHTDSHDNEDYARQLSRMFRLYSLPGSICLFVLLLGLLWWSGPSSARPPRIVTTPAGSGLNTSTAEKHLVIASFRQQDVDWIKQIPSDWRIFRYFMDDPYPPNRLSVPRNNGREAMAYLTYIIDNYDNLPDFVVFTHGHYRSWHQPEPLPLKIRALNLTALDEDNYISFRCEDNMGCERRPYIDTYYPNWEGESFLREFWRHIMPHEELPRGISYKCCGQHATTRRAIRARSKKDWTRMRSPMLRDKKELMASEAWARGPPVVNDWVFGMFFEKIWHILLGQGAEFCPSVAECRQRHFSNAIICDSDLDFTMFEGTSWKNVTCRSAFDGLKPDEAANLKDFHAKIPGHSVELRSAKAAAAGFGKAVSAIEVFPPPYVMRVFEDGSFVDP